MKLFSGEKSLNKNLMQAKFKLVSRGEL
jgi:hypothetical protein